MKSIVQVTESNIIKEVLAPIYNELSYDGSPDLAEYMPQGIWYLLREDQYIVGIINLESLNNVTWCCHIYIWDKYRGNNSTEWGQQVMQDMKEKHGAKKLLAFTPYKAAELYAKKLGFNVVGTLTESIQKNGKLLDQILLEKDL